MNDRVLGATVQKQGGMHREVRWPLRHMVLAGAHWPAAEPVPQAAPVVMIHGWLDNCLSFCRLAPMLTGLGDVYAIDMAGHGHSDHRPPGQSYLLVDYIADLAELLDTHFDGPVRLVGHSLGGIVALMYTAAFPEKVECLTVIDSLGPISRPASQVIPQLRSALLKRRGGSGSGPVYASIDDAARARAGGLSPLSEEAAHLLVPRNLREVEDGYRWRSDPRLRHPSMMMLDEEQVMAVLASLTTPMLLLLAEDGILAGSDRFRGRSGAVKGLTTLTVPGSHHCHLDGEVTPVADAIRDYLQGGA